jgi:hypothetical protein
MERLAARVDRMLDHLGPEELSVVLALAILGGAGHRGRKAGAGGMWPPRHAGSASVAEMGTRTKVIVMAGTMLGMFGGYGSDDRRDFDAPYHR